MLVVGVNRKIKTLARQDVVLENIQWIANVNFQIKAWNIEHSQ